MNRDQKLQAGGWALLAAVSGLITLLCWLCS